MDIKRSQKVIAKKESPLSKQRFQKHATKSKLWSHTT